MLKKKFKILIILTLLFIPLVGCGKAKLNLNDYIIEKRESLYTAHDDLYCVTLSTGVRENNYNFDGIINEMVPFGVLTLSRCDNSPLANDTYSYIVTIGEQNFSGFLEKGANNTYSTDLEINDIQQDINVQISFTGYTFNQNLENTSSSFNVDSNSAIKIAEKELKEGVENILKNKNVSIETVMKLMKDYSNKELKNYYWYIGVISTNGETLGILIDANNGDIIAKKV